MAYNSTSNRKLRIQIISLLAHEYTYATISRHNPKKYTDTSSANNEETEEEDQEARERARMRMDEVENIVKTVMADLDVETDMKFNPPVSRYIFRKARAHYASHKHALAPIPRTKVSRWHWSLEVVVSLEARIKQSSHTILIFLFQRAIVSFVQDPLNTQQVCIRENLELQKD